MNLAHKHDSPQGEVIEFPKQERQVMSQKAEGHTPLPNFICDEGYLAVLDGDAIACLIFINRYVSGFHVENRALGESLVMKITGIKDKRTVRKKMSELEKFGLISIHKEHGKSSVYTLTFDERKPVELVTRDDTSNIKVGTSHVTRPVTSHATTTSDMACHSVKENILKENIKNMCSENPVEAVLNLWTPNLDALNAWLQRSGIAKMTQSEVDGWLLEINGYYSTKLEAGLLTDTQMYTNFVKWIKRNFSSRKPAQPQTSRNVNDAWANNPVQYTKTLEEAEIPEDWV
ncbi:TPA: replication protein [Acinetobacter baumannii]|uniref:replication protein n=1 Tax=Acinetobacter baumannii TaxID=470 RepID=UPI0027407D95|nr:replication protein [Acinetobacter baumannii]MDP7927879.1 replication protein [Acinetobacter baumannii]HCD9551669.1 replication protein [Acinetobacter baumannii]HCD9566545.1 replication protein [Acinetobacter baumannii]HCD9568559.1 replication protein [Acinetobacter baumannii]HCD9608963.1 replication protein [Acinetobacter baumannii]